MRRLARTIWLLIVIGLAYYGAFKFFEPILGWEFAFTIATPVLITLLNAFDREMI